MIRAFGEMNDSMILYHHIGLPIIIWKILNICKFCMWIDQNHQVVENCNP